MAEYCRRDVQLLEQVYKKMADHMPHSTHQGVLAGGDKWTCAHCGSDRAKKNCTKITAAGVHLHQMQCKKCGRYYQISEKVYQDYLETKK